jgi:hypothetical protein
MLREAGPATTTDTVLAVDFGSANTRALLFDVVGSAYRFIGYGEAPSTINAPYRDASEGMRHALDMLQAATGRRVLDDSAHLIMPATTAGSGTDAFVATSSGGPALRGLLVGLLPDVSLQSVRRLASSSYIHVLDSFSLGDRRGEDEQIDAVIAARPELLVIAGGSDGGASDALLKLVETISLACHLLPPGARTRALFAGNQSVTPRLNSLLGSVAMVSTAANVQPELGQEQLGAARAELGRIYEEIRLEQIGGFAALAQWSDGRITPTAQAGAHFIRFLSQLPAWPHGVLGVDVGSANTSLAAAWRGDLRLNVQPGLGLGESAASVLAAGPLELVTRWLPEPVSDDDVRDFIYNKSTHPNTVPADPQDLYLELALARQVIRAALAKARPDWPETAPGSAGELLPSFSLVMGGGAVLGHAPRPGLAALLLLDALQPAGVTRLMVDPYHLAPALGAAAGRHPVMVAQIYDSLAFLDLGTAVSLIGRGKLGDVACTVKLAEDGGEERSVDVPFGGLAVLPLAMGANAKLTVRPRPGFNAGFAASWGRALRVRGGMLGVIIDARGRPLALPKAAEPRQKLMNQWFWKMGGI